MKERAQYQTSTSMNDGVLEIVVTGRVTELDIPHLQKEFKSYREAECYRMLVDIRALDKSVNPAILFFVICPERVMDKTAIVDISENKKYKSFWENLANHHMIKLKWFCNIDDARDWLKYILLHSLKDYLAT